MNQSRRALGRTGLVVDGGAPRCPGCGLKLHFGTDRHGRTTEWCACGYRAYLQTRASLTPAVPPRI